MISLGAANRDVAGKRSRMFLPAPVRATIRRVRHGRIRVRALSPASVNPLGGVVVVRTQARQPRAGACRSPCAPEHGSREAATQERSASMWSRRTTCTFVLALSVAGLALLVMGNTPPDPFRRSSTGARCRPADSLSSGQDGIRGRRGCFRRAWARLQQRLMRQLSQSGSHRRGQHNPGNSVRELLPAASSIRSRSLAGR